MFTQKLKTQLYSTFLITTLVLSFARTSLAQSWDFEHYYVLSDYKGRTYLNFMREVVKPAMDQVAQEGYVLKGREAVERTLAQSDGKIKWKMGKRWGGLENVLRISEALEGQRVTLNDLPQRIRALDQSIDIYGLATFLGLASGGGVALEYDPENISLNVHYDVSEQRSGRSFGVGPTRWANDASDKQYLDDLQSYLEYDLSGENFREFYANLFRALLDSDTTRMSEIELEGQTVLTDFLAVFTAEQARNLMDNWIAPHWDAALLEVTLLGAFHAGQSDFKLFYRDLESGEVHFTDTTKKQEPCQLPTEVKEAQMRDYWQFSRNIDNPKHCRRSGINITKKEFRTLGSEITSYVKEHNPELFGRLKAGLGLHDVQVYNLYEALSDYLIDYYLPAQLSARKVKKVTRDWVEFLAYVKEHADDITHAIAP